MKRIIEFLKPTLWHGWRRAILDHTGVGIALRLPEQTLLLKLLGYSLEIDLTLGDWALGCGAEPDSWGHDYIIQVGPLKARVSW